MGCIYSLARTKVLFRTVGNQCRLQTRLLMWLQVIVDWDNRPLQRYWMAFYLLASTLMLNIYAAYGWSVASESGADKVGAQWSIVFGQCLLIGNFWYTLTCFEQQLISMNKVRELHERCPRCFK